MRSDNCPFCDLEQMEPRMLLSGWHWFVIGDNHPVGLGHALIILKRHHPDMFSLSKLEWEELRDIIELAKENCEHEFSPDGYNIGVNCGAVAGQTVFHLHIHLIPRYKGDVENPRGGIRNFKKPLVPYD